MTGRRAMTPSIGAFDWPHRKSSFSCCFLAKPDRGRSEGARELRRTRDYELSARGVRPRPATARRGQLGREGGTGR